MIDAIRSNLDYELPSIYFACGFVLIAIGMYVCRPRWGRSDHNWMRIQNATTRAWASAILAICHIAFVWYLTSVAERGFRPALAVLWSMTTIPFTFIAEAVAEGVAHRYRERGGTYWSTSRVIASVLRLLMFVAVLGTVAWVSLSSRAP